MNFSPSLIDKLRALPLHQRHLFMWGGSAVLFLLVAWLWTFQLRHELASLGGTSSQSLATVQNSAPPGSETKGGVLAQLGLMFDSIGKGAASLTSFMKDKVQTQDTDVAPTDAPRQGDELNQFLPYQPFPEN